MSEMGRRTAKRQIEQTREEINEFLDGFESGPHNEEQPIIDRLEGAIDPFDDFAQGDDYDDLVDDGE